MAANTITEQIYQKIKRNILSREIAPGEKLTVKMLHERYGASSSPIREALTRLQQDGLISYTPNAGMTVTSFTIKDLKELFTVLTEFDAIALRLTFTAGNTDLLLECLEKNCRQMQQAENNEQLWEELSDEFHLLFYKFADNSRLSDGAEKARTQLTIFSNVYEQLPANKEAILEEHLMIVDAIRQHDPALVEKRLRAHGRSSYLKALETVADQM